MSKPPGNESGYSLVEVLVSILILSVAIVPMFTMFDSGLRAAVLGSNYDEARTLANSKLEEVKGMEYSAARTTYPPSGSPATSDENGFSFEIETRYLDSNLDNPAVSPATSYMQVEVKVSWDNGDNEITTTGLKVR